MPIQAPQWTDYLNCPVCCREFGAPPRSPISLGCGHTLCKQCLRQLHRKQCPFDQTYIHVEPEELVVNTALLHLAGYTPPAQPYHPPCVQALTPHDREAYDLIVRCMEQLAAFLKCCGNANNNATGARLSRPMQRKLVTLLQCAITDEEGRGRAARAARSLGERTVTELILQHQHPQQLSAHLWAAVRARGCQFLGPAMQEEVLKLVLLALEDGSALSRKVLVMFVVQRLEPHFPQASKTSIGHVVQLLYRASCFRVSKRESDSSLMQLKEDFRSYETLRREHDTQIVQIATEAGLRIAPDQWSALLYGDTAHKSHMQSIIDKLQTPQSFTLSVQELFIALQRNGDPTHLLMRSEQFDRLTSIEPTPEARCPTWQELAEIVMALKDVVSGLIQQVAQNQTTNPQNLKPETKVNDTSISVPSPQNETPVYNKYKPSTCRDAAARAYCPRGATCTYTHSEQDNERPLISDPLLEESIDNGNEMYLRNAEQPVVPPPTTQANNVQNIPIHQPAHQVQPHHMQPMHNVAQPLPILHPHQYPPQLWHIPSIVQPPPAQDGAQANQINEQPDYRYRRRNGYVYPNINRRPIMDYGVQSYHYMPPSLNNGWANLHYPGIAVRPPAYGGNYEYVTENNNFYPVHQGPPAAPATGSDHMPIYAPHPEPSAPNIARPSFIFDDLDAMLQHNVQQIPTFAQRNYPSFYNNEQQRSVYTLNEVQNSLPIVGLPIASVPSTYALPTSASLPSTGTAMPSNNAAQPSTSGVRPSTSVDVPSTGRHAPIALPPNHESNGSGRLIFRNQLLRRSVPDESDQELEQELLALERRFDSEYELTE